MNKSNIRFALIGSGNIATIHAQAITAVEGAELAVVWGRDPQRASALAARYGAEFVPEIEAIAVREDIDAATIATPSGAHAMAAVPLLKKGKAVLCEKPLEITLPKMNEILSSAAASRTPLAGILQLRLGAGAQAMKRALDQGRFGRLAFASAYLKWWRDQAYYDAVDWRGTLKMDGGGALMNQGIHGVDLLQWLVGLPSEVYAFAACQAHERIEVEDSIAVSLRYPTGAVGVIEASTACHPGTAMRIEVCGDHGSATLEDDRITRWDFADTREEDTALREGAGSGIVGGSSDPNAIGFEGHRILIEDLVHALWEQRPPLLPGTEASHAIRLILACYASARRGYPVKLSAVE